MTCKFWRDLTSLSGPTPPKKILERMGCCILSMKGDDFYSQLHDTMEKAMEDSHWSDMPSVIHEVKHFTDGTYRIMGRIVKSNSH